MDNVKPGSRGPLAGASVAPPPGAGRGASDRSTTLALRWLVSFSKTRREKTMVERLANEILDASNGRCRRQASRGHSQDG